MSVNYIVAVCAYFSFLSIAICAAAWLASKSMDGWGWIIFVVVICTMSVSISQSDHATCPECGHYFKVVKESKKSVETTDQTK